MRNRVWKERGEVNRVEATRRNDPHQTLVEAFSQNTEHVRALAASLRDAPVREGDSWCNVPCVSRKIERVRSLVEGLESGGLDPRYAGYFECFNRQQFFEAHEVLEDLWLEDRHGSNGAYYKGLIQLAGAFVHVRKGRPGPAVALLRLARKNLGLYPSRHEALDLSTLIPMIDRWLEQLSVSGCRGVDQQKLRLDLRQD